MQKAKSLVKKWAVEIIAVILIYCSFFLTGFGPYHKAIEADGSGYYAYLPAAFIYQDAVFSFTEGEDYYTDFWARGGETDVNKYFIGPAILWMPFFLLAHALSIFLGYPPDGYSSLYQHAIVFAAIFYAYIGLKALQALLDRFTSSAMAVVFILFVMMFGTNLFHYTHYNPSMSHVYSFSLIAIFLLGVYKVIQEQRRDWLFISLAVLGLLVLVRPINLLIIIVLPFIAGDFNKLFEAFKFAFKNYKFLIAGVLVACLPAFLQMLSWYLQSGLWIVYSYGEEGFNWGSPVVFDFLFSYRKGWFVWTPVAFISLLGFFTLLRKSPFRFSVIMFFWATVVYVLSSWWMWSYGMSFGMRPMIDFLPAAAIGLALLYNYVASNAIRLLLSVVLLFCIYLNIGQNWQWKHYVLSWDGVREDTYWDVFMKFSKRYEGWGWSHALNNPLVREKLIVADTSKAFSESFESLAENRQVVSTEARTGTCSNIINKRNQWGLSLMQPLTTEDTKKYNLIQASCWYSGSRPVLSVLVLTIENTHDPVWKSIPLRNYYEQDKEWNRAVAHVPMPKSVDTGTVVKVFGWNDNTCEKIYIDDIKLEYLSTSDTAYKYEVLVE